MNKILLICVFLPLFTSAQTNTFKYHQIPGIDDVDMQRIHSYEHRINAMIQKQETKRLARTRPAERATSISTERLIANSTYNYNTADTSYGTPLGIIDSVNLKYSGQRGSVFNLNSLSFELPDSEAFLPSTNLIGYYAAGYTSLSLYNMNETETLPDSLFFWYVGPDTPYVPPYTYTDRLSETEYNIYDVNNNPTLYSGISYPFDLSSTYCSSFGFANTFQPSGNNITGSEEIHWSTPTSGWDTNCHTFYYYNSAGWLIEDSGCYGVARYYYNASGNMDSAAIWDYTSGVLQPQLRVYIDYNADNTLQSDSESAFTTFTNWLFIEKDSFGYSPGIDYWTFMKSYLRGNISGTVWYIPTYSKHVASSGLPDTFYAADYTNATAPGNIEWEYKTAYTYDAYGNPSASYKYEYVLPSSPSGVGYYYDTSGAVTNYFYYENYLLSAVHSQSATNTDISIYPNPATTTLTIIAQSPIYEITIINLLGQAVYENHHNTSQVRVDVSALPTGVYFVKINGSEVRKFVKE